MVLVRVLGSLAVEGTDGASIPITRPVERRILVALAAMRPHTVATDTLIDAVWSEDAPPSARKTLQTNVSRLRHRLGDGVVLSEAAGYRLADAVAVDADEFEAAAASAGSLAAWDSVLGWFRGSPFDELWSWPPVEARRARLDELHRAGCEARAEAALAGRSSADEVARLEELVTEEPLREHRWCLLIRALAAAGRTAEAAGAAARARQVLHDELGIAPGVELQRLETTLATTHEEGDGGTDWVASWELLIAAAEDALRLGDPRKATEAYRRAGRSARAHEDHRRFALAALGASGDGWQSGLDATSEVVSMLREAVDFVPAGPTAIRARLLARLAVARSHHGAAADGESAARTALAIARSLHDPGLEAETTYALAIVIDDPVRREEHRRAVTRLMHLASGAPGSPWRRRALPLVARLRVADGEIRSAIEALDDLARESERMNDHCGTHAAAHRTVLAASVHGDWKTARLAARAVRSAGEVALVDPDAAQLAFWGMLGIIDLCEGTAAQVPSHDVEWPRPSMAWSALAWSAVVHAAQGDVATARRTLLGRDLPELATIERDGYWLPTLAMLAEAAHLVAARQTAELVASLLEPHLGSTIADPGLIYRGCAVHFAGLSAATCGRKSEAKTLLVEAARVHESHASGWMTSRSTDALARLT